MPLSSEVEAKLDELKRAYLRSLIDEAARVEAAAAALLVATDARVAAIERERVHEIAHRLTGSAALFGLPQISAWARAVSRACRAGATHELHEAARELAELVQAAHADSPAP